MEWERERRVRWDGETWRIITVYVNKDLEEKLEKLKERAETRGKAENILIGGDFNARTRGGREVEGGRGRRGGGE